MKILFVNPPVIRIGRDSPENDHRLYSPAFRLKVKVRHIPGMFACLERCGVGKGARFGVRAGSRWPWTSERPVPPLHYPFIMGYAAGLLKKEGFSVNLIDAVAEEEYSYQRFLKRVRKEQADIVVIECSTPTIDIDLWMTREISKFARVALAGPHLTIHAENIAEQHSYITYILKGEYIISSLKMAISQKIGIYESEVVTDLDDIPYPYRNYPSSIKYFDPTMPTAKPQLQLYSGKGCPFKCTFCMWPHTMYKGIVCLRKPENIAREIRYCIEKFGFKSIFFDDDTFNLGTERISKLCDELKKIGLPWTMMGRLDCSPDWLYDKMVDSGCVGMRFGIETFDYEVLKRINKGIERVDFKAALKYIEQKYPDIYLHLTMMKNLPGQTEELHQKDMKILHEMGFSQYNVRRSYQLSSCAPFPGTKMYEEIMAYDPDELKDFSKYDGFQETVMNQVNKK